MEILGLLPIIISFITLIVFFGMASNISAIRRKVDSMQTGGGISYSSSFNMGELREFQGKKQEALDCYKEALFLVDKFIKKNGDKNSKMEIKNREQIVAKVQELGSVI